MEILGHTQITALADKRFYADEIRSIDYGGLARYFLKEGELAPELREYFASFDLILTYLPDSDGIFEANLRRSGAVKILRGPARLGEKEHAARQLAALLGELGLVVNDFAARLFPSADDKNFALEFLNDQRPPLLAFHPGSGSAKKCWPIQSWVQLVTKLLELDRRLLIVGGEADGRQVDLLRNRFANQLLFAINWPLPRLAAVLAQTIFIGHDSGISHLAAAAGARSLLLFGPTDPAIWAPQNENARIIRAPDGDLAQLDVATVKRALAQELMRIGIST